MPTERQNFAEAPLTVLACTDKWMGISGQASLAIMIKPGSDMMSASGFKSTTGDMSLI